MARRGEVYRISGAPRSLSDDVNGRTRRYLVTMTIRTACLIGAFLVPSPWRWGLLVGAVFLPMISVVMANAGRERIETPPTGVVLDPRPALGAGEQVRPD